MPVLHIEREISASAAAVWEYVSWLGYKKLAGDGMLALVDCDGDEIGALRTLVLSGDLQLIEERLTARDENAFAYSYQMTRRGGLPLAEYRGRINLRPLGNHRCLLAYECDYEPLDKARDKWPEFYRLAQAAILDLIEAKVTENMQPAQWT